jgi:hypothetical protein
VAEYTLTKPSPGRVDSQEAASTLWQNLVRYQPSLAGALAIHLRNLPEDWPQREFGVGREAAVLTITPPLPPGQNQLPEAAPHTPDIEECQACAEAGLVCRWHDGQGEAHQWWQDHVMAALRADPEARVEDVLLHQEAEAEGVACRCRRCTPAEPVPVREPRWRRAVRFFTNSL